MYSVIFMSESMQQLVLGQLAPYLHAAEDASKEWFDARWRSLAEDETKGILLK